MKIREVFQEEVTIRCILQDESELALGRGDERKSYTEMEKHVQGSSGRKTQCAEIPKGQLDWHIESEREPGTGCGSDHARLVAMIMIFTFSLRAMESYKSRVWYD